MPFSQGSPPRMRGKPYKLTLNSSPARITPAYAGKTAYVNRGWAGAEDHPRVCGENFEAYSTAIQSGGSPPRMRGKRGILPRCWFCAGITPAYAGKTKPTDGHILRKQDHPRVCGENFAFAVKVVGVSGSPPRMRGKLAVCISINTADRITPAYAGKTAKCKADSRLPKDHPRVCGENTVADNCETDVEGSPPADAGKTKLFRCFWLAH